MVLLIEWVALSFDACSLVRLSASHVLYGGGIALRLRKISYTRVDLGGIRHSPFSKQIPFGEYKIVSGMERIKYDRESVFKDD